ncbi:MAG: adenylate/guanylate cyclase domain-containing protein [Actinomycetota bacterium]
MSDLSEVRRPLTTVFVDLVGSTPLSIELDEEDYAAVLAEYRRITGELADLHGGFIPRDEGDGRFFWFGWPTARHDDAHRAVSMCAALLEAIGPLSQRVHGMCGRSIDVRVGVHTGSAIVAIDDDIDFADVSGASINFAAKVQAAAAPGTILISESTQQALRGQWILEASGSVTIDSLEGEIEVSRVLAPSGVPAAEGAMHGRAAELDRLPPEPGESVALIGPAGLGKSRLIAEYLRTTAGDHVVFQAEERRSEDPFGPILDQLRSLEDYAVPTLDPADPAAGIVERVCRLAGGRALEIIFEDVHWLDPSSIEVVDRLVSLRDPNLRIIITGRWLPPLRALPSLEILQLQPLPMDMAEQLLGEVAPALDRRVVADLLERANGNPFFLTWLGRAAGETFEGVRRILRPRSGVPIVVQQAVRSQIDAAAVSDEVTTAAAVIGHEFGVDLLVDVVDRSSSELSADLGQLIFHGIIAGSGPGTYRFAHSIVHELAYDLMLGSERRERHARVADVLEATAPSDHASIGFHLDHAGRHREAIERKFQAAELCRRGNAYNEASTLIGRAVELVDQTSDLPDELELNVRELNAVVSTTIRRDGYVANTSELTGILELLGPDGDAGKIALAKTRDWTSAITMGDLARAQRLNYEVFRTSRGDFPPIGPYNSNARALLISLRGHHRRAECLFDRSVEEMVSAGLDPILEQNWATVDDPIVIGVAWTASTLALRGRLRSAKERLALAQRRAEALTSGGPTLAHLANTEARFHAQRLDGDAVLAAADRLLEVAEDLRLPIWQHQGGLHRRVGEAILDPSGERLVGLHQDADLVAAIAPMMAPELYHLVAMLARRIGDDAAVESSLDAIDTIASTHRIRHLASEVHRLRSTGSADPAASLAEAVRAASRSGARRHLVWSLLDVLDVNSAAEIDGQSAAALLTEALAEWPEPEDDPDVERARVVLAR